MSGRKEKKNEVKRVMKNEGQQRKERRKTNVLWSYTTHMRGDVEKFSVRPTSQNLTNDETSIFLKGFLGRTKKFSTALQIGQFWVSVFLLDGIRRV